MEPINRSKFSENYVPRVYIAGRITGKKDYQKSFEEAKSELIESGYQIVLNPAVLPEGMEPSDYMRICLSMVDTSDIVVLLPGWRDSKGAQIERIYAEYIGKDVVDWEAET